MSLVATLIQDHPRLHVLPQDDRLYDFHSDIDLLADLENLLSADYTTIETGCGWSTVVFAGSGAKHLCVMPHSAEAELVKQYCAKHTISTTNLEFMIERSEVALPKLPAELLADVVLIDGRHAFPTPIIDWFYLAKHLKVGGAMIIDDTDIKSCQMVYQFMRSDEHWQISKQHHRYAIFTKLGDDAAVEWWRQQNFSKTKTGPWGIMERTKFWLGRLIKNQ